MTIELEIPHPDEERSYAELRSKFRAAALAFLRSSYAKDCHELGWSVIGDPATARSRYTAGEWARELDLRLCEPVSQDFGLGACPLGPVVEKQARAALEHSAVTWDDSVSGVCDHDAPACADVTTMTDEQLCTYVDDVIKESDRG